MHNRAPDGGFGWVIVLGCFVANTLLVGMSRSFGVIYVVLLDKFQCSATAAAWVHAIFNTTRMVFGPLSSVACERFSCRKIVMFGGLLLSLGVMLMAFSTNIFHVYLTYAALGGFGGAFIFTPTLIIIGQYFNRRKGTAMALATVGSGLGTLAFAPLFTYFFSAYGFVGACLLIGAMMLNNVTSGAILRPVDEYLKPVTRDVIELTITPRDGVKTPDKEQSALDSKSICDSNQQTSVVKTESESETVGNDTLIKTVSSETSACNVTDRCSISKQSEAECNTKSRTVSCLSRYCAIFNNRTFALYCLNITCMPLCIQTIYLIIPRYVEENGMDKKTAALLVSMMGLMSSIGRLTLGLVFDLHIFRSRRRLLHSVMGICFGVSSTGIGLWQSFWPLAIFCACSGFFEGGFHGQRATVLSEMVPPNFLSLSVGYMIFCQGVGNLIGPVWAGMMRDVFGIFETVFIIGGLVFAASSLVMFLDYVIFSRASVKGWCQRKCDMEDTVANESPTD